MPRNIERRRNICVLAPGSDPSLRDCKRHMHISRQEARRIQVWKMADRFEVSGKFVFVLHRVVPLRGTSAKFGVLVADALRRGESWARSFVRDVQLLGEKGAD